MSETTLVEKMTAAMKKVSGEWQRLMEATNQTRSCPTEALAVAALRAMREPTDGMRNEYYRLAQQTETFRDAPWERAIDAALAEIDE